MIFVDSSAWYALTFSADRNHPAARARFSRAPVEALVTTDHVLVETWLLINSRFGHRRANEFWSTARGLRMTLEIATLTDLQVATAIGASFDDQTFSIVDLTSFAVMERLGVTQVISFDDDFVIYRYGPNRERAFEVLR